MALTCRTHGDRLKKIGQSTGTFGFPPTATEVYYLCAAGCPWTHFVEANGLAPGLPKDVEESAIASGVLTPNGELVGPLGG